MAYSINKPMSCRQAQHLVDAYILNDPSLTVEGRNSLESHLRNCPKCTQEYEKAGLVMNLVTKYWSGKPENQLIIERSDRSIERRMTAKEGWKDLLRRCPDLAVTVKHQKRQRLLHRVSAVAACLVLGVSVFLAFSSYLEQKIVPELISHQAAFAVKPSVRIELVSKGGNILVPANQQIASNNKLKRFVINGKHQMMMNTNTILAVEPLIENNNIGCLVKLTSGQIYTHVQQDGNPFVVDTAHGKAVITGTAFDIKATENSTTLVVSEGAVQFESDTGAVNVAAGQTSKIIGQSAPSTAVFCNTAELTAWATRYTTEPALAQIESNNDLRELPLSLGKEPIILAETDYDHWVEQKRDWFKQQFPWIFQLKDALAKEGVEADYPELLIQSGDIWQFAYPENSLGQIPILNLDSLLNAASHHGFNKQWLQENIPVAKFSIDRSVAANVRFTGLKAFEEWIIYLEDMRKSSNELDKSTLLHSLHAGTYLVNTRTLAWLYVENNSALCKAEHKKTLSSLLQKEINAAYLCTQTAMQLMLTSQKACSTEYTNKLVCLIRHVKAIYEYQKAITSCEFPWGKLRMLTRF